MISRATGLFSIYRGTDTNDSGDEIDVPVKVASDIPMGVRNRSSNFEGPNADTPRQTGLFTGRASHDVDLRRQDRIKDQVTGAYFQVEWVSEPASSTRNSDLMFGLHRVS
jgi:hypothetical protein